MKYSFYIFLAVLQFACSDGNSQATSSAAEETTTPVTATETPELAHPCDILTGEGVADMLGWAGSNEAIPTTMKDGRLQSCFFSSTNDVGAVTITFNISSEKAQERKGLERSFTNDLSNTDGPLSYKTVPNGPGDQALFGHGKRGPNHTYRLRWRNGNAVESSIDLNNYGKELSPEAALEKLLEMTKML